MNQLLSQTFISLDHEDQPAQTTTSDANTNGGTSLRGAPQSPSALGRPSRKDSQSNGYHTNGGARLQESRDWADAEAGADDGTWSLDDPVNAPTNTPPANAPAYVPTDAYVVDAIEAYGDQLPKRPKFDRQCTRTIQLLNLPEGTTHADIVAVVRGGILLDIFLRTAERSATVSFLLAPEARAFFDHVRRHGLEIKHKRVRRVPFPLLSITSLLTSELDRGPLERPPVHPRSSCRQQDQHGRLEELHYSTG